MRGFFKRLIGATEKTPPPAPLLSDCLFVFSGAFPSELAATDYALGIGDGATLSSDLGGAAIGADDVEVIFGKARLDATRAMLHFKGQTAAPQDANTFILLSDRGYDGNALSSEQVVFLGLCSVS